MNQWAGGPRSQISTPTQAPLKIYLIRLNPDRAFFYAEPPPNAGQAATHPAGGLAAWIDRHWSIWRNRLTQAEGHMGRTVRWLEQRLKRFVAADESMFHSLEANPPAVLVYPACLASQACAQLWAGYLARERRRHGFWLAINGILLPPALLLTILPGPNVFGFWFAFRVLGHARALIGIRKARQGLAGIQLEPCPALDQPLDPTLPDTHSVARLMAACQFTQLEAFLERHGREAINGGILASANHP